MAMELEELKQIIEAGIPDGEVVIEDLKGDGEHYAAHIKSESFKGMTKVKQHQMVYKALGLRMPEVHALVINTSY